MIKKKIIVSSCDNKYFNLLTELFLSLKNKNIMDEYNFGGFKYWNESKPNKLFKR